MHAKSSYIHSHNVCCSWNSSSILAENLERKSYLLANFLSPMAMRQPDLFFRTLRNELYPVESTEQVHIYDACCPVFYPANVCMGIGPNIFKQKFDKVFLIRT